jgi:hypothetical protein
MFVNILLDAVRAHRCRVDVEVADFAGSIHLLDHECCVLHSICECWTLVLLLKQTARHSYTAWRLKRVHSKLGDPAAWLLKAALCQHLRLMLQVDGVRDVEAALRR